MSRLKDHSTFAIGFAGVGYIIMWPLCVSDLSGELFGASLICGEHGFVLFDWLCRAPHPLQMSVGLHALGLMSAIFVVGHFLWRTIARRYPTLDRARLTKLLASLTPPAARPYKGRMVLSRPLPRTNFGLRRSRR